MKNDDLIALNNKLSEAMEWMLDRDINGDGLEQEIRRQLAFNELAKTKLATQALIIKAADVMSTICDAAEVDFEGLPLLPLKKKEPLRLMGKTLRRAI